MDEAGVERKLGEIVARHSPLSAGPVTADLALARELGFDSFAFLMLLTDLEREVGLTFPLERIEELRDLTFRGLVRFVTAETASARAGTPMMA